MSPVERDEVRERRITMEIVADAHDADEQAMGWYYYLDDVLSFPFLTRCAAKRAISPLRVGDEVEVIGMAPQEECEHARLFRLRYRAVKLRLTKAII